MQLKQLLINASVRKHGLRRNHERHDKHESTFVFFVSFVVASCCGMST